MLQAFISKPKPCFCLLISHAILRNARSALRQTDLHKFIMPTVCGESTNVIAKARNLPTLSRIDASDTPGFDRLTTYCGRFRSLPQYILSWRKNPIEMYVNVASGPRAIDPSLDVAAALIAARFAFRGVLPQYG
jgi:hypothetical protein